MRVTLIHSYYSRAQPSGENNIVDLQASSLRETGHEVQLLSRETDIESKRRGYPAISASRVATGRDIGFLGEITQFHPDVVHVHNLFPNIGHQWIVRLDFPLVVSLHNFRPVCAAATLFRAGRPCTECLDYGPGRALRHRCYRASRMATLPWWMSHRRGISSDPLLSRADRVIVLSPRAMDLYTRTGLDSSKIAVVQNPCSEPTDMTSINTQASRKWLYVGRLSVEKGIDDLVANWPEGLHLDVIGDGPLRETLEGLGRPSVNIVGPISSDLVRRRMSKYDGLIFPSRWFEGAPLVYPEALSVGLPIVALTGSSVADDVFAFGVGRVIDDLQTRTIHDACSAISRMGASLRARARTVFEERYTIASWVKSLEHVYRGASERYHV